MGIEPVFPPLAKCRTAVTDSEILQYAWQLEMGAIEPVGDTKGDTLPRSVSPLAPPTGIEPITNP